MHAMAREEAQLHRRCVKILQRRVPGVKTYRGDGGQQLAGGLVAYRLARLEGRMKGAPDVAAMVKGGRHGGPMPSQPMTTTTLTLTLALTLNLNLNLNLTLTQSAEPTPNPNPVC